MKAEKYLKIINRMCNVFEECSDCPNYKVICNVEKLEVDVKKAVEIAEEWDKEHPGKTRLEEFLRIFPNVDMEIDSKSGRSFPDFCIKLVDGKESCVEEWDGGCSVCREDYWDEEV